MCNTEGASSSAAAPMGPVPIYVPEPTDLDPPLLPLGESDPDCPHPLVESDSEDSDDWRLWTEEINQADPDEGCDWSSEDSEPDLETFLVEAPIVHKPDTPYNIEVGFEGAVALAHAGLGYQCRPGDTIVTTYNTVTHDQTSVIERSLDVLDKAEQAKHATEVKKAKVKELGALHDL